MDVIGMTNLQEAKLAREAEICYVTVAMVTDYDCWHPGHDAVEVTDIIRVLAAERRQRLQRRRPRREAHAGRAHLQMRLGAADTRSSRIRRSCPPATLDKLEPIVGKYFA